MEDKSKLTEDETQPKRNWLKELKDDLDMVLTIMWKRLNWWDYFPNRDKKGIMYKLLDVLIIFLIITIAIFAASNILLAVISLSFTQYMIFCTFVLTVWFFLVATTLDNRPKKEESEQDEKT